MEQKIEEKQQTEINSTSIIADSKQKNKKRSAPENDSQKIRKYPIKDDSDLSSEESSYWPDNKKSKKDMNQKDMNNTADQNKDLHNISSSARALKQKTLDSSQDSHSESDDDSKIDDLSSDDDDKGIDQDKMKPLSTVDYPIRSWSEEELKELSALAIQHKNPDTGRIKWVAVGTILHRNHGHCKDKYRSLQQLGLQKGPFSAEEDEIISTTVRNWKTGKKGLWSSLQKRLGRISNHIWHHWHAHLVLKEGNDNIHPKKAKRNKVLKQGPWEEQEIEKLKDLVTTEKEKIARDGKGHLNWKKISEQLQRHRLEVRSFYQSLHVSIMKKTPFEAWEDLVIINEVKAWGDKGRGLYRKIERILNRSSHTIRSRWFSYLKPRLNSDSQLESAAHNVLIQEKPKNSVKEELKIKTDNIVYKPPRVFSKETIEVNTRPFSPWEDELLVKELQETGGKGRENYSRLEDRLNRSSHTIRARWFTVVEPLLREKQSTGVDHNANHDAVINVINDDVDAQVITIVQEDKNDISVDNNDINKVEVKETSKLEEQEVRRIISENQEITKQAIEKQENEKQDIDINNFSMVFGNDQRKNNEDTLNDNTDENEVSCVYDKQEGTGEINSLIGKGGIWSNEETQQLLDYVATQQDSVDWKTIAKILKRSPRACVKKHRALLVSSLKKGPFSPEEDRVIRTTVAGVGKGITKILWMDLEKQMGRTGISIKRRWEEMNHGIFEQGENNDKHSFLSKNGTDKDISKKRKVSVNSDKKAEKSYEKKTTKRQKVPSTEPFIKTRLWDDQELKALNYLANTEKDQKTGCTLWLSIAKRLKRSAFECFQMSTFEKKKSIDSEENSTFLDEVEEIPVIEEAPDVFMNSNNGSHWENSEVMKLIEYVNKYEFFESIDWAEVSKSFNKTEEDCKEKFSSLKLGSKKGAYTPEEDETIMQTILKHNQKTQKFNKDKEKNDSTKKINNINNTEPAEDLTKYSINPTGPIQDTSRKTLEQNNEIWNGLEQKLGRSSFSLLLRWKILLGKTNPENSSASLNGILKLGKLSESEEIEHILNDMVNNVVNNTRCRKKKYFTPEEDKLIIGTVEKYGDGRKEWSELAVKLQRHVNSISQRYRVLMKDENRKNKQTDDDTLEVSKVMNEIINSVVSLEKNGLPIKNDELSENIEKWILTNEDRKNGIIEDRRYADELFKNWENDEARRLIEYIESCKTQKYPIKWILIAKILNKTVEDCRKKYRSFECSCFNSGFYTPEEDEIIEETVNRYGKNRNGLWAELEKVLNRSSGSIVSRWKTLKKGKKRNMGSIINDSDNFVIRGLLHSMVRKIENKAEQQVRNDPSYREDGNYEDDWDQEKGLKKGCYTKAEDEIIIQEVLKWQGSKKGLWEKLENLLGRKAVNILFRWRRLKERFNHITGKKVKIASPIKPSNGEETVGFEDSETGFLNDDSAISMLGDDSYLELDSFSFRDRQKQRRWTEYEINELLKFHENTTPGTTQKYKWNLISEKINRTPQQCRNKLRSIQVANQSKTPFTKEEDELIEICVLEWGEERKGLWVKLEKELNRSTDNIKLRWKQIQNMRLYEKQEITWILDELVSKVEIANGVKKTETNNSVLVKKFDEIAKEDFKRILEGKSLRSRKSFTQEEDEIILKTKQEWGNRFGVWKYLSNVLNRRSECIYNRWRLLKHSSVVAYEGEITSGVFNRELSSDSELESEDDFLKHNKVLKVNKTRICDRSWKNEEVELLLSLVSQQKSRGSRSNITAAINWESIANILNRTTKDCENKFNSTQLFNQEGLSQGRKDFVSEHQMESIHKSQSLEVSDKKEERKISNFAAEFYNEDPFIICD